MANHPVRWPQPRGPHPVGFVEFALTDPHRPAPHAPQPTPQRELKVLCWYPAVDGAQTQGLPRRRYMDPRDVAGDGHASFNLFMIPQAVQAGLAEIETAAFTGAPVAAGRHPLIAFCHGVFSFPQQSSVMMEHLASQGTIVVSVAHPHESGTHHLPDGRRLEMDPRMWPESAPLHTLPQNLDAWFAPELSKRREALAFMIEWMRGIFIGRLPQLWADDLVHVVDCLANGQVPAPAAAIAAAADLGRLGYLGMSFGGHVAALCCLKDPRARAGANLDGGVFTAEPLGRELGLPFLAFTGDLSIGAAAVGRTCPAPTPDGPTLLDVAYQRSDFAEPAWPLHRLGVPGTKHYDFADFPLLFDPATVPALATGLPLQRWLELQVRVVGEFFDQYLRGIDRAFPAPLAREFEDLLVVHRPRTRP